MDDDYMVEVVGLLGDDGDHALDEGTLGTVQEIKDFLHDDNGAQDGDDWEPVCGVIGRRTRWAIAMRISRAARPRRSPRRRS